MSLDTRNGADRDRLVDAMMRDIEQVLAQFDPGGVLLENSMWDPVPPWHIPRPVLEPEVIAGVVRRTECRFLFDLAHAVVSAKALGIDPVEYIGGLPTERIGEMHVTGIAREGDLLRDHRPLTDDDWRMARWAFNQVEQGVWGRPWLVAYEYGGVGPVYEAHSDRDVIARQVPELLALVRGAKEPSAADRGQPA
jgi:uncharacterized protein (UPF0276 family)